MFGAGQDRPRRSSPGTPAGLCYRGWLRMPISEPEHLADSIRTSADGLIEELHAVRDSVEELYILLDHIWRNREELRDILASIREERAEREDEIIACCHCDASPPSLAAAVREGWKDLQFDDGDNWNYLGLCPDCVRRQTEDERQLERAATEMGLTPEQIRQAKAEGVTSALGLRRIEKNNRSDEIPETIACAHCDADSPLSLAAALQEGWTRLQRDDGTGWNYLGVCPECQPQENAVPQPDAGRMDEQKQLFG